MSNVFSTHYQFDVVALFLPSLLPKAKISETVTEYTRIEMCRPLCLPSSPPQRVLIVACFSLILLHLRMKTLVSVPLKRHHKIFKYWQEFS